ncbi:MAG: hypothetical protein PHV13_05830 [Candidatus ainarchaeum sp.]|nr:hypothetical protein [Candidatus ainarchaeum sp.]
MTVYNLRSGGGSTYVAIVWGVVVFLTGAYLLATSLWPPSLLAPLWLAVAALGGFFTYRAWQGIQDYRKGAYPVSIGLEHGTFTITYGNGSTKSHGYDEIRSADGEEVGGAYAVHVVMKDGTRYMLTLTDVEFVVLTSDLQEELGTRFRLYESRVKARKDAKRA